MCGGQPLYVNTKSACCVGVQTRATLRLDVVNDGAKLMVEEEIALGSGVFMGVVGAKYTTVTPAVTVIAQD